MDLTTKYMGIDLKNPIIVGACNLVKDIKVLKALEESGAAAIVYKSLFEEQIHLENLEQYQAEEDYADRHAEMTGDFLPEMEHAGPQEYLSNLREAKEALNIPLFASLNAVYEETWVDYAKKIEDTGVDGIELNFYAVPKDFDIDGRSILTEQVDILEKVRESIKIPIAVKLSPYYTSVLYTIGQMDKLNVDAFVLFNRLFQPEIDIDKETHYFPYNLSSQNDNRLTLRYAGLLHGNIKAQICANHGIFTGEDVAAMILAGANTVQVVSTLYKNGLNQITTMLEHLEGWMEKKNYNKLDDFRGKLSRSTLKDPFVYKRAQYVDILLNSNQIFKKYPMI